MLLKISKNNKIMFSTNAFLKLQSISLLQYLVGAYYYTGPKLTPALIGIIFQMFVVKL